MKSSLRTHSICFVLVLVAFASQLGSMSFAGEMHEQRMGQLVGAGGHHAEGTIEMKGHNLTMSGFEIDKVPDGRIYLTNDSDHETGVEIGRLTQYSGTVQFTIPPEINPDDFNSILIWCEKFSVEIGRAPLTPMMK